MPENCYDLIVVGGGPGGYTAAIRAVQLAGKSGRTLRVLLVEKERVGGTCLHWGCIPTKALIASMESYRNVLRAKEFGVLLEGAVRPDLSLMMDRKGKIVENLAVGIEKLLSGYGVECVKGTASFLSPKRLRVRTDAGDREVEAESIILATGSRPRALISLPFDGTRVLSSNDILVKREIPRRIIILGGGVIGCEFTSLLGGLGSEVVLVEAADRILPFADGMISTTLTREFKKRRIELFTGRTITESKVDQNGVECLLSDGNQLKAECLLVSIGRILNTDELNLSAAGLTVGSRDEISVDERMATSVPGIFAIGDVCGGPQLAHAASAQGCVAAANAVGGDERFDSSVIPYGVFTHPEIGSVGMTEEDAIAKAIPYRAASFPVRILGKAQVAGELAGEIKAIAHAETDRLLGLHVIGPHAAELVHEGAVATQVGMTSADFGRVIHSHPAFAEGVMEALHALHGLSIHAPKR